MQQYRAHSKVASRHYMVWVARSIYRRASSGLPPPSLTGCIIDSINNGRAKPAAKDPFNPMVTESRAA